MGIRSLPAAAIGKNFGEHYVESFETKPHRLPTRTAPGPTCQGTGKGRPHKSSGGKGRGSRSASPTISEQAKSTSPQIEEDGGRQSASDIRIRKVQTFKRNSKLKMQPLDMFVDNLMLLTPGLFIR